VSVASRLDRLERLAPRCDHSRLDEAARDAEIERLAEEYEAREGPGAFTALLAQVEAEFEGTSAAPARPNHAFRLGPRSRPRATPQARG
jgi:hypothetical protein